MNRPIDEALAVFAGNITRLAEACGVTRQALSQAIRDGRFSPTLATAIQAATGVSRVRLVFGDDEPAKPAKAAKRRKVA